MKTWKTKRRVCRGNKTGKFAHTGKCGAFARTLVKAVAAKPGGQFTLFGALVGLLLLTGCVTSRAAVDRMLFTPTAFVTNVTPAHVVNIATNRAVVITATNAATGAVSYATNREPVNISMEIPASVTVTPTEWAPNAGTIAAIQGAGSLVPGYGQIGAVVLTALLGLVAQFRSRKYRAAALSIAQGVQTVMETLPPEQGAAVVQAQKQAQDLSGTRDTVRNILKALSLVLMLCLGMATATSAEVGSTAEVKAPRPRPAQHFTRAQAKAGALVLTTVTKTIPGDDVFPATECIQAVIPPGTNAWQLVTVRPDGPPITQGPFHAGQLVTGCRPVVTNGLPVIFLFIRLD